MNSTSSAFAPSIRLPGLFVSIGPGSIYCNGSLQTFPQQDISVPANSVTLVYLDLLNINRQVSVATSNAATFPPQCYPLCVVRTGPDRVTVLTDMRPDLFLASGGSFNSGDSAHPLN